MIFLHCKNSSLPVYYVLFFLGRSKCTSVIFYFFPIVFYFTFFLLLGRPHQFSSKEVTHTQSWAALIGSQQTNDDGNPVADKKPVMLYDCLELDQLTSGCCCCCCVPSPLRSSVEKESIEMRFD